MTSRVRAALVGLTGLAGALTGAAASSSAETLNQALSAAYQYNPRLDAERSRQRATDEEVPRALSGYRPKITASGDVQFQNTNVRPDSLSEGKSRPKGYSIDAVQPIFRGGQTYYGVAEAEATVRAGRETLRDVEQQVMLDAVTAYVDVIRDTSIVQAREKNVQVLTKELQATKDRFAVGEVTKTDVAQVEARRAGAVSALEQARANLLSRRAIYEKVIGHPPEGLSSPAGYESSLPRSLDEASSYAASQHPTIIAALYSEEAARNTVDRIRGELLPEVQLEASYTDRFDSNPLTKEAEQTIVAGRVTMPIYEGGEVYARVRQAKQTHIQRLQEVEQARTEIQALVTSAWSLLVGAKQQVASDVAQVQSNQTALEGVREEERVGQRTVLDVLDAENELVNSEVQLTTDRRNVVVAAYTLLQAMGKLDMANIGATEMVYDPEAHYQDVRRKWWGVSITDAEGRTTVVEPPADGGSVK